MRLPLLVILMFLVPGFGFAQCDRGGKPNPLFSYVTGATPCIYQSPRRKTTVVSGPGIFYTITEPIVEQPVVVRFEPPLPAPPFSAPDDAATARPAFVSWPTAVSPALLENLLGGPLPGSKPLGTIAREYREKKAASEPRP